MHPSNVVIASFLFTASTFTLNVPGIAGELQDILSSGLNMIETRTSLEDYVSKHPKNADARYQLALSYLRSKMEAQAEEQLRTCMEFCPAGSELHMNCINSLRQISETKFNGKQKGTASNEIPSNRANGANHIVKSSTQTFGVLRKDAPKQSANPLVQLNQMKSQGIKRKTQGSTDSK